MTLGVAFFVYAVCAALQYGNALRFGNIEPNFMLVASVIGFMYLKRGRWLWFGGAAAALGMTFVLSRFLWLQELALSLAIIGALGIVARVFQNYYYGAGVGLIVAGTIGYDVVSSLTIGVPVVFKEIGLEVLLNSAMVIVLQYVWKKTGD